VGEFVCVDYVHCLFGVVPVYLLCDCCGMSVECDVGCELDVVFYGVIGFVGCFVV